VSNTKTSKVQKPTFVLPLALRDDLLQLARDSIAWGLKKGRPIDAEPASYPPSLRPHRATFVTLKIAGELRGCIGTLAAHKALVVDVADNAFSAAFRDPRFPPMTSDEVTRLAVTIAILSPPVRVHCQNETELLDTLRPGRDGLILTSGHRRGTFLPSVWDSLPDPRDFLAHLKIKAGIRKDDWPSDIIVERYSTETF
jgi:AmmeMemoRadiSam system protein A